MKLVDISQPLSEWPASLQRWLSVLVVQINESLKQTNAYDINHVLPNRYSEGEVYYFAAAVPTTAVTSKGWWGYDGTTWVKLG